MSYIGEKELTKEQLDYVDNLLELWGRGFIQGV